MSNIISSILFIIVYFFAEKIFGISEAVGHAGIVWYKYYTFLSIIWGMGYISKKITRPF